MPPAVEEVGVQLSAQHSGQSAGAQITIEPRLTLTVRLLKARSDNHGIAAAVL